MCCSTVTVDPAVGLLCLACLCSVSPASGRKVRSGTQSVGVGAVLSHSELARVIAPAIFDEGALFEGANGSPAFYVLEKGC